MYATSKTSPKIYGLNESSSLPEGANTLPYWIEKAADDGSLLFNEHQSNKIARFDPSTDTLYESWIPTQYRLWVDCPPSSKACGIANVLQFSRGATGQTWFAEWSENKIDPHGIQYSNHPLPFSVSASPQGLTLKRSEYGKYGNKVNISTVRVSSLPSPLNENIEMLGSGTFTPTGDLGNSTGSFSEQSFSLEAMHTKEILFCK